MQFVVQQYAVDYYLPFVLMGFDCWIMLDYCNYMHTINHTSWLFELDSALDLG